MVYEFESRPGYGRAAIAALHVFPQWTALRRARGARLPQLRQLQLTLGAALVLAAGRQVGGQLPSDSAHSVSAEHDSGRVAAVDSARQHRVVALEPVRVTALGGSLAPDRVPYAVSVIGSSDAARLRAPLALDEALRGIPGLAVDNRYNIALGERITIRGFGARTQFGVRGVHVDVDGIPATMPDGQTTLSHVDPGTVAGGEVLRGPASSLYGNASGGVVRLTTLSPLQLGNQLRISTGIAELGTVTTRASVAASAGRWGGEVRASSLDYRGYREHSNARDVRGGGQLVHAAGRDTVRLTLATADYDADNPGGLTDSASVVAPRSASATNLRYRTGETGTHRQAGLAWRRAADGWTIDATAWGLTRDVVNPIPQRIIDLGRRAAGGRVVLDRAALGRVSFGVGFERGVQRDDRRSFNSLDGIRGAVALDQKERVVADGAFARAALALAPALSVLGSVRGDQVAFHVTDRLVTATDPNDGGSRTMRALSPSVGIAWVVAPRFSTYANVATSFETPTTTELANRPSGAGGINPDLAPQRVVGSEVGMRAPLGSVGSATVAVFDAHIRDALVPFEVPSAPGRQFYRNASRARQRGVEGSASALVAPWLLTRIAATLVDARFSATDAVAGLVAGRRIPGVAPFRADLSLAIGAGRMVHGELLALSQSRTPANDANSAWAPAFTVVDMNAGLAARAFGGVSFTTSASVANVFDRRYDTSVVPNAARGRFFEPGPGRTITVMLEVARRAAPR